MSGTGNHSSPIVFGPFTVDVAAGQVHKNGRLVRLPEQPFQVLVALLERPGEVVTREELQEKLWAGETFVDFDQGLNNAINKLRDSLGDSAANPRFVETLPRRGYRFIHPLGSGNDFDVRPVPPAPIWKTWLASAIFGIAAVGAVAISPLRFREETSHSPLRRFSFRPEGGVRAPTFATHLAISPDGHYIAYAAGSSQALWIQDLTVENPRFIRGSEGARFPFWSPDSEFVLYSTGGELRRVRVPAGPSTTVCRYQADFAMGAVSPDGDTIVFADGTPPTLFQVPFNGGEAKPLFTAAERSEIYSQFAGGVEVPLAYPKFLPGGAGDRILLFELGFPNTRVQRMMVLDIDSRRRQSLGPGSDKSYSPTGHLVYQRGANLWAVSFSRSTLETAGEPFLVRSNGRGPTVASDGTLVYLDRIIEMRQLTWRGRNGSKLGTAGEPYPIPADYAPPRISPQGDHIAIQTETDAASEIWVHDRVRNVTTRLTTNPAYDYTSAWSPDGTQIVFSSNRDGDYDIFLNERERSREPTLLAATPERQVVSDWSRDGKFILYRVSRQETRGDLDYLERSDDQDWKAHSYLQSKSTEIAGRFSPDGRFVAYQSDETGRWEIYVRQFPDGGGKLQISNNGGWNPRWRADGKELFYAEDTTLMVVPISTGPEIAAGRPKRLFEHPVFGTRLWDVSADGQQFLLAEEVGDTPEPQIRVVQNWFEEFRGREQN